MTASRYLSLAMGFSVGTGFRRGVVARRASIGFRNRR